MKNIKIVILLVLVFLIPKGLIADDSVSYPTMSFNISIETLVSHYSDVYDIQESRINRIIKCESGFNPNAHNLTKRENSWGLVQINLLAHKNISKEDAIDPYFSIPFLAENVSKGKSSMWTCAK